MIAYFKRFIKESFPQLVPAVKTARGNCRALYYKTLKGSGARYVCPICKYTGPFLDHSATEGRYTIKSTECPKCELFERHRLQYFVLQDLISKNDFSKSSVLHFAPEPKLEALFERAFETHHTTDIVQAGVDYTADICALPFADQSYDLVFASHVLEHVMNDEKALLEIKRILRPGGIAVLPVPIVSNHTIEYPEPNEKEFGHVRACGADYFDKYRKVFSRVDVYDSSCYDESFQLYTIEDRSFYPTSESPLRTPMQGEKHLDYVPVCYI